MTRDELLEKLRWCVQYDEADPEATHCEADRALIDYLNDSEVTDLYNQLTRWCA